MKRIILYSQIEHMRGMVQSCYLALHELFSYGATGTSSRKQSIGMSHKADLSLRLFPSQLSVGPFCVFPQVCITFCKATEVTRY